MLYLGLVAGVAAGNVAARAAGIDAFRMFAATLVLIGPALVGARAAGGVAGRRAPGTGTLRRRRDATRAIGC